MKISDELRQQIEQNTEIKQVFFDRAGRHHFNAYPVGDKLYSRHRQPWEEAREEYEIIEIVSRETILEQELEEIIDEFDNSRIRPILAFQIFENNKTFNCMAVVTNLTLTSTAPVTFNMTVLDANNNNTPIAGVLSGLSYNADATQDIAVVDPNDPLSVDIHAVAPQGGTTVTGTGNFVSTLLGTDGKTPAFSGTVTGTLVLVNNIPVAVLKPILAFNQ